MNNRIEKEALVDRVAARVHQDVEHVGGIVDATLEEIYQALKRGEMVTLRGFGSLYVRPESHQWVFKFNPGQGLRALFGWASTYRGPI
jgi:DNA-binding protein HU-beta